MDKKRCFWVSTQDQIYKDYHDNEWGIPCHDEHYLFESLSLEAFQAGLSWITILKKRENFRKAFDNFDLQKVKKYDEKKIESLMQDAGIIRNRLKILATINNAKIFEEIQKEFGSFDKYIWHWTDGKIINNKIKSEADFVATSPLSDAVAKDLKKRGMKFLGSTTIYAYLQAIGVVNDHEDSCFLSKKD